MMSRRDFFDFLLSHLCIADGVISYGVDPCGHFLGALWVEHVLLAHHTRLHFCCISRGIVLDVLVVLV